MESSGKPLAYANAVRALEQSPKTWLVTGAAGFIGSHLLEELLRRGQKVIGLDNLSTGKRQNLTQVRDQLGVRAWSNFSFVEADIRDLDACRRACEGVDYILHEAALGSVSRSIVDPISTNASNVTGFLNLLVAAKDMSVKRVVYAASSSTYGDHPALPKIEDRIGRPLSPYAVTKYINELYADVFARCYDQESIGLRYFNVFGPRQDPSGAYAAVIPRWVSAMLLGEDVIINGTGETSRDFCYVANAVQANILAATVADRNAVGQVYNVAVNARTTLLELFDAMRNELSRRHPHLKNTKPIHRDFRVGDVLHSQADIAKARNLLGYEPTHLFLQGLLESISWYEEQVCRN